jgi:hypothetical protein
MCGRITLTRRNLEFPAPDALSRAESAWRQGADARRRDRALESNPWRNAHPPNCKVYGGDAAEVRVRLNGTNV